MWNASHYPATGLARGDPESRHARQSGPFRRPAGGDQHHRQAGLPSHSGRPARLRTPAATVAGPGRLTDLGALRPATIRESLWCGLCDGEGFGRTGALTARTALEALGFGPCRHRPKSSPVLGVPTPEIPFPKTNPEEELAGAVKAFELSWAAQRPPNTRDLRICRPLDNRC